MRPSGFKCVNGHERRHSISSTAMCTHVADGFNQISAVRYNQQCILFREIFCKEIFTSFTVLIGRPQYVIQAFEHFKNFGTERRLQLFVVVALSHTHNNSQNKKYCESALNGFYSRRIPEEEGACDWRSCIHRWKNSSRDTTYTLLPLPTEGGTEGSAVCPNYGVDSF